MSGVTLFARVRYSEWKDGGRVVTGDEVGKILDRGPENGTWWVSAPGGRGAVLVSRKHMTAADVMHGRRG